MTEYEYDQGLRISAIKYPDERSVRYEYNGLGQLTGIQNADREKYATKGTYDSLGRLISLTAGNGVCVGRKRLFSIDANRPQL